MANPSYHSLRQEPTLIPTVTHKPLSELLRDRKLDLIAANGEPILYDGWVELTFNLPGNDDPNLTIRITFLVSLVRLLLGFSVIQELILGQEGGSEQGWKLRLLLPTSSGSQSDEARRTTSLAKSRYTHIPWLGWYRFCS